MKSRILRKFPFVLAALVVTGLVGCGGSKADIDADTLARHRSRLALAEEPAEVLTVADVRDELLAASGQQVASEDHAHGQAEDAGHDDAADGDQPAPANATEPMNVAMVGRIGGLVNPWKETRPEYPFVSGEATFFLADPAAVAENEASGHVHAPGEECAFCEAHAPDNSTQIAIVRFVDESGAVLPVDARELFEITSNETVVVSGSAKIIEGGILVVDGQGIYIRR